MKTAPPFLPSLPWVSRGLWVLFFLWMAAETVLSSLTPKEMPTMPRWENADKVVHACMFAIGACLLCMALRMSVAWRWIWIMLFSVAVISLYGWLDELHQLLTPGRSGADVGDWMADTLGGILGSLFILALYEFHESRRGKKTH